MMPISTGCRVKSIARSELTLAHCLQFLLLLVPLSTSFGAGSLAAQCTAVSGVNVINWTNTSGNWSVASNWDLDCTPNNGNPAPGDNYAVTINSPVAVISLDINAIVDSLALQTGALTIGSGTSVNLANQPEGVTDIPSPAALILGGAFTTGGSTSALAQLNSVGGALTLEGQTLAVMPSSGTFSNSGVVNLQQTTMLSITGDFNNNGGSLQLGARGFGGNQVLVTGTLNNRSGGQLSVNASTISVGGSFTNDATSAVGMNSGGLSVGGNFINQGSVNAGPFASTISVGGMLNNSGSVFIDGGLSAGSTINSGNLDVEDVLSNMALGNVENSGTLSVGVTSFAGVGNLNNTGSVIVKTGFNPGKLGGMSVAGTFDNAGTLVVGGGFGCVCVHGPFNNNGNVAIMGSAASLLVNDTYTQDGGVTTIEPRNTISAAAFTANGGTVTVNGILDPTAVEIGPGAAVEGNGTINGNVAMGGTIIPGAVDAPGTLTINGNYEQIGSGVFDEVIGGPQSNGSLFVNGAAALDSDASLQIVLLNGFNPIGDSFTLMDYNSLVGAFSGGTSFAADGYNWTLTYGSSDVVVTAVSATPEPGTLLLVGSGLLCLGFRFEKESKARFPPGPSLTT